MCTGLAAPSHMPPTLGIPPRYGIPTGGDRRRRRLRWSTGVRTSVLDPNECSCCDASMTPRRSVGAGSLAAPPAASPRPVQGSFDELGTPLCDVTFCVVDLETTGGNRQEDRITEIGAVKVRGGECLGTFQTLVNPGRAIPPPVTILTGLTDAMVAPAPRLEAVLPAFVEFTRNCVMVGHNVGFDLAVLRRALHAGAHPPLTGPSIDTVALARRLVREEVPDCRLGTLASRFRLDHRPTHRALDDALATVDLLHLLIERAAGLGVLGLDDLASLPTIGRHPQAAKLRLANDLPRAPGVYLFCGHRGEVLYVGKATNLRQRVRSYFGGDERRKIGPLLRETQSLRHHQLPDPITAEVVEARLIARLLPRYNRAGTRTDRYCYVRLDTEAPWPRLAIVRDPSPSGVHLGPLPSRTMAGLVVDALQSALPLRRCTARLGRRHLPAPDATACAPAQMGVAACPCAGLADRRRYDAAVRCAVDAMTGVGDAVGVTLRDRMETLSASQRFEEAALARDRLSALQGAVTRTRQMADLAARGRFDVRRGAITWIVDRARLIDVRVAGSAAGAIPVPPPPPPETGRPLARTLADEALLLARRLTSPGGVGDADVVTPMSWRPDGRRDRRPRDA
ncbi:MAG: DEDD exonuclease domain-containing protein [Desertimonas sp.]